jgi:hypothetical protein
MKKGECKIVLTIDYDSIYLEMTFVDHYKYMSHKSVKLDQYTE